ncbi:MAG: hypothetical protein S4CHLAM102_15470 [Chlamydiia bacterium]|nr:hypothetical protein [Chlamydiia bacterium]
MRDRLFLQIQIWRVIDLKQLYLLYTLLVSATLFASNPPPAVTDNLDKAVEVGRLYQKPLLIFFTGGSSCQKSREFLSDTLNDQDFQTELDRKFILVKIEFAEVAKHTVEKIRTNYQVKEKYQIFSLPTLVMTTPEGDEIAQIAPRPISPEAYGKYLFTLYDQYFTLAYRVESGKLKNEVKKAYQQAKQFSDQGLINQIIEEGLKGEDKPFFALEKYTLLLQADQLTHPMREELESIVRASKDRAHQKRLALLEFQQNVKEHLHPRTAVGPIVAYLQELGEEDLVERSQLGALVADFLGEEASKEMVQPFGNCTAE